MPLSTSEPCCRGPLCRGWTKQKVSSCRLGPTALRVDVGSRPVLHTIETLTAEASAALSIGRPCAERSWVSDACREPAHTLDTWRHRTNPVPLAARDINWYTCAAARPRCPPRRFEGYKSFCPTDDNERGSRQRRGTSRVRLRIPSGRCDSLMMHQRRGGYRSRGADG